VPRETERIVLVCGCGKRLTILGREEDWCSRQPVFRCECGWRRLTIDDRICQGTALGS
jgi:hypothetical protein